MWRASGRDALTSTRRRRIEINLGRGRNLLLVLNREVRLVLVAERHRGEVGRERADGDVIVLHRFDVAIARHRDAVLGYNELRHQIPEQRVRFELRIEGTENRITVARNRYIKAV